MRHSVEVESSFPTLTLSLGERGQPAPAACFAHTRAANTIARMARGRRTILPLPGGEGWGEGKANEVHAMVPSVFIACSLLIRCLENSSLRQRAFPSGICAHARRRCRQAMAERERCHFAAVTTPPGRCSLRSVRNNRE